MGTDGPWDPTPPFAEGRLKAKGPADSILGGGQGTAYLEVPPPRGHTQLTQFLQGPWLCQPVPYMTEDQHTCHPGFPVPRGEVERKKEQTWKVLPVIGTDC